MVVKMDMDKFLFDKKWVIYQKIQKLKQEEVNVSNIAQILKISRDTVYKYMDMKEEDCIEYIKSTKRRKSIFDKAEKRIKELITEKKDKNITEIYKIIVKEYDLKSSYRNFLEYTKNMRK